MTDDSPRLYLIAPPNAGDAAFPDQLAAALDAADVACVRLRMRDSSETEIGRAADRLRPICHERDVALLVSDFVGLVEPLGLDGVHLESRSAKAVREARKALGRDRIVGAFGGASKHTGMTLAEAGVDYVSLGPIGEGVGLGDETATPELFEWWFDMIETPVVAEGRLSVEGTAALAPFIDFLAPSHSVWDHPEGAAAAVKGYAAALAG